MPSPKPPVRSGAQPASSAPVSRFGSASDQWPSHTRRPPKPRHRVPKVPPESILLDPWLTTAPLPQGQPVASLIGDLAPRLAKVRVDAAKRQIAVLACVLANFAAAIPALPLALATMPAIAVPQGKLKATRYDNPAITGRQLKPTLDALVEAGLIVRTPAIFKERRTTVQPTDHLAELMASHNVTATSITRLPNEEVIILRLRKGRAAEEDGETFTATSTQNGNLIDYPDDCQEANALRSPLRRFNAFIAMSDIRIEGRDNPPPPKPFKRIFATSGPVRFNLHGRLYVGQVGGWHQGLPKAERHLVRINGEKVAEIDFNAMHLRLAYAEANRQPPSGDLYAIPGLEAFRPAIKIVCSAMLSIAGELTKLPSSVREVCPELPKHWTARRIASAVKAHHPAIAHLFGKDRGIALMHTDSTLLMMVLTRLMECGLPALPLHDAILVQQSAQDTAIAAMREASMVLLGVELPVSVKG